MVAGLLRALKEGGHKCMGVQVIVAAPRLKPIFSMCRRRLEDQTDFAVGRSMSTAVLIELGDGSARSIGREPPCVKTQRDSVELNSSSFDI